MRKCPALQLEFFNAKEQFLKALEGVRQDAEKERITGSLLKQVFYERQLKRLPDVKDYRHGHQLQRYTLRDGHACVKPPINSERTYTTIEPLRALFKSEVKRLGERLAMPKAIMERQPFPAAGLASRIMGDGYAAEAFDAARSHRLFSPRKSSAAARKGAFGSITRPWATTPTAGRAMSSSCAPARRATARRMPRGCPTTSPSG